jgi:hypothetical protein
MAGTFRNLWEAWKRIAHKIGNFQARVLVTLLYVVVVLPFGLMVRSLSDPLQIKKRPMKWTEHASEDRDMSWARKQ